MIDRGDYLTPVEMIELGKRVCGVIVSTDEMVDDEVRTVVRWVGVYAPDTEWEEGKPVVRRQGIEAMLFVTICVFPRYFERYRLAQWN